MTHEVDGTVCTDRFEAEAVNASVKADGTGYVRTPGDIRLYRRVDRIRIVDDPASLPDRSFDH